MEEHVILHTQHPIVSGLKQSDAEYIDELFYVNSIGGKPLSLR